MPSAPAPTARPPARPATIAMKVSSGSITSSANRRGQHQQFDRVQAQRADCIDLLAALHRADLRGECAGGAAGEQDRGQQHGELAQEGDRDQFDTKISAPKSRSTVAPRKATTQPTMS
jgi:aminoglycoside phosphotransferase (APT) family kinase protein